jgi:dolichol kinase
MEVSRKLVHIGVGAFALLLRDLTWPQAVALATIAIVFNAFVLPGLAPGVLRDTDRGRRWTSGIVLYPAAVLALLLLFPSRLDLVATTWAILAAGDGMATLVGAHVRTRALPWNRQKSVGGLVAFILFGGAAAAGMTWWSASPATDGWLFVAPIAAAVLAG